MSTAIPSSTLQKFTTFGDLLRFLRRRAGMTQMELAIAVDYSDAQISRLEQNLRKPDIPTIAARFVPALGLEDEPEAVARLLDLAANVHREDAPDSGPCPYKGLTYFDEADVEWFVGREALTAKLAERLLALAEGGPPSGPRFLAVVGASGSGKSSLVRAGLAPSLRRNKASAHWAIHILTPTAHPLESLAMALTQAQGSVAATGRLMDDLASEPRSLHLFAQQQTKARNSARLLLVVDQFEEVFALCRSEEERAAFIANLLTAASAADGPVIVVITLRADFYAHCAGYPQLREALAHHQEYIGAMKGEELRRAIEEPARRGRWELETGLVAVLLRDVGQEPGALPLLSHALLETWRRRRGRLMTLSGYASSGGVQGAIAETAEAVFADQFTPQQRAIARRIFLRLTELGDESGGDTRRRATLAELSVNPDEAALTQTVLQALADARLIIVGEDSVEVAHEALIREWPTLRSWLEDDRQALRLHRQLTVSAQEWARHNHEPDLLYRGARLAQAWEWAGDHQDEMNDLERAFLAASQALAEQEAGEREAQRQRQLEAARKLAEAERQRAEEQARAARQLRKRAVYLATALVVALGLAALAGWMGWQARRAGQLAASRELAAASIANLAVDAERSLLLASRAVATADTAEAEDALHQAIRASRVRLAIPASAPGASISVAFSPDGSHLATASADETVKLWDAHSGQLLFTVAGHAVAFRPDGEQLATVLADRTVRLWDAETGAEIALAGPIDAGDGLMFSPDGARLATVTPVNLPRIWDLRTATEVTSFPGHTDYVSFAFFSPDGARLLSTSDDGTARVWSTATGEELLRLEHPGLVWTAAFSPDGKRIATLSNNQAFVWDAASGAKLLTLNGVNTLFAVAFSPDGTRLATGGQDHKVIIWDAASGRELLALAGHSGAITGLAFSPDGTRLASAGDDGTTRIWDITPASEAPAPIAGPTGQIAYSPDGTRLAGIGGSLWHLWDAESGAESLSISVPGWSNGVFAFSPDGSFLVTASGPNATLRDAASGQELVTWPAHTGRINALAFDPSGTRLATASDDYKVKVWDFSPQMAQRAEALAAAQVWELPAEVDSLAFSSDGTRLAIGVHNGAAKIWDLASGTETLTLLGHSDAVAAIAFSPDGKRLATASLDGTGRVWDAQTGQELFSLTGHASAVQAVVFRPDGMRLATASRDGTAKVWDAETGQELLTLSGDGAALSDAVFSPDGRRLVVSGEAGISVYLLDLEDLKALARARVTRSLTKAECQQYLHRVSSECAETAAIPTPTPLPRAANGRICQITNTGGLNDNYFNTILYQGLQDAARLHGWEPTVLQSASTTDFESNMHALLGADCRLIAAPFSLFEVMRNAAQSNPEQRFLMLDMVYDPPLENIWNQVYATDQAAFLAGYAAASVTRTGKVGVFGGIDTPQVTDFMDGFALGVAYFNQQNAAQVEVLGWDAEKHQGMFLGAFCCSTEGRQLARRLLDQGADIILPVAGKSVGWGAGAEVQAHGNAWLIGVDLDWAQFVPEFADVTLTSIEKRWDVSVEQVSKAIVEETFHGGVHVGTLQTGEVGLSPFYGFDALISDQVKADLERIAAEISAGTIQTKP